MTKTEEAARQKIMTLMRRVGLAETGRLMRKAAVLNKTRVNKAAVALLNDAAFLEEITR